MLSAHSQTTVHSWSCVCVRSADRWSAAAAVGHPACPVSTARTCARLLLPFFSPMHTLYNLSPLRFSLIDPKQLFLYCTRRRAEVRPTPLVSVLTLCDRHTHIRTHTYGLAHMCLRARTHILYSCRICTEAEWHRRISRRPTAFPARPTHLASN